MTRVQALQTRYAFTPPAAYAQLEQQGRFEGENIVRGALITSVYLWLQDVKMWWTAETILNFTPPSHHKDGFIPFASNPAGDFWCWSPERATEQGVPVIFCPHDEMIAQVNAPHFTGWLYRRILEYAGGQMNKTGEAEARAWLVRWHTDLSPFLPPVWNETMLRLSQSPLLNWDEAGFAQHGFITPADAQAQIARDLAFAGLNQEFAWMN